MEIDKTNTDGELYGDEEIWDYIPEVDYSQSDVDYSENPEKIGQVDWVDGKPVLSFSSLCDKTKSIFSAVKGVDIQVTEQDGENYIFQANEGGSKPKFIINIPKKPVAGLNRYTAFNHELGHYAFDSFNNMFNLHINEELSEIPKGHQDKALEIYRSVFNIIEDHRVESLMGAIYLGTGKRFVQARKRMGKLKPESHKAKNPIEALHCAREFRNDCVTRTFGDAKYVIDKIQKRDNDASILLAKHYIKTTVNPWLKKQFNGMNPQGGASDPKKPITSKPKLDALFKKQFKENRKCDHRELTNKKELEEETEQDMREKMKDFNSKNKKDIEKQLDQSKHSAQEKIKAIRKKIEEDARQSRGNSDNSDDRIREYKGTERFPNYDYNEEYKNMRIARQLNKIFKLLQARSKPKIADTGDNISIPAVIRRKSRGYGDIHIKSVPNDSLAVVVSIDASGSMSGKPISIARNMMAVLFKSIEGINNVKLKGVVWSGTETYTSACEVADRKDLSAIQTNGIFGGGTPTPNGVNFSLEKLAGMKGKKKLLIVCTDGYPNSSSEPNLTPEQQVRKHVNQARKKNVNVFGIGIGMRSSRRQEGRDDSMETMFGKSGYITTMDMEDTEKTVIKKFRDVVIRQMRN
jgi:uncharacterized protein with von Willebrand factor type A (vWA) domain